MFDKFGEFDSVAELNAAAAGLLAEGDVDSLKALAAENGLSDDELADYVEGMVPEIATPINAAFGRIRVQKEADPKNLQLRVVAMMAQGMIMDNPEIPSAIMKKGKRLSAILDEMKKVAQSHATGTGSNRMSICCGTDRDLEKIIETYYLAPDKLKERLEALYESV